MLQNYFKEITLFTCDFKEYFIQQLLTNNKCDKFIKMYNKNNDDQKRSSSLSGETLKELENTFDDVIDNVLIYNDEQKEEIKEESKIDIIFENDNNTLNQNNDDDNQSQFDDEVINILYVSVVVFVILMLLFCGNVF